MRCRNPKPVFRMSLLTYGILTAALAATACRDDLASPRAPRGEGGERPVAVSFGRGLPVATPSFRTPTRLAYLSDGSLLVSDFLQQMVYSLDAGSEQPSTGVHIQGRPTAVGVSNNLIYVANQSRGRIEKLSHRGQARGSFGAGILSAPMDLVVDEKRRVIYVTDGGTRAVHMFDLKGSYLGALSGVTRPTGIAIDFVRQEVLVADYGGYYGDDARVHIYEIGGSAPVDEISGAGSGWFNPQGGFSRPQGVAVGPDGHIYIADALLGEILVFDRVEKEKIGVVGTFGKDLGELFLPMDLVIDDTGTVVVTSSGTSRIERYTILGGALSAPHPAGAGKSRNAPARGRRR